MRKVASLTFIIVCTCILLAGCSKAKEINKSLYFSFDKNGNYTGFSDLPSNYTVEKAKDDGYFVMQDSKVIGNSNLWDNFIKASSKGENANIRIVQFYNIKTDGPYFLDLFYNKGYYYLFDSSSENQKKQPYSYLLTLKGQSGNPLKDSSSVVLTNDNTLTFDKLMKALLSSNLKVTESISPFKIVILK